MSVKKILIAEDEKQIRFSVSLALKLKGYEVLAVEDGALALKAIEELSEKGERFNLLITDIQMPNMNGETLIYQLLQLKIPIPILVMTGFGDKEMVTRLMRLGCKDFLDKPFETEEIEKRVDLLLDRYDQSFLDEQRKEQLARIGESTRGIAHDLNNMLMASIGYAEMVLMDPDSGSKVQKNLKKVIATSTLASKLCKNLLSFNPDHYVQNRFKVEVNTVLEHLTILLKDIFSDSIQITFKSSEEPLWCYLNLELFQQMIFNLCMNAADAMPKGGELQLILRGAPGGNSELFQIVVSDSGEGIPQCAVSHLFEEGFSTKKKGSGIGLCVVKKIVDFYGGSMEVQSWEGIGTQFILTFSTDHFSDK